MKKWMMMLSVVAFGATLSAAPAQLARVDMYNTGGEASKIELVDKNGFSTDSPKWMARKTGAGMLAQIKATPEWQEKSFKVKAVGEGRITINLMGPDIRKEGKKQPHYVDYSLLQINDKKLLDTGDGAVVKVWHDAPKSFSYMAKDGEELNVKVKFRSSAD